MVEELAKTEKEARKARLKTRMLWLVIILDILLLSRKQHIQIRGHQER